MGEIVRPQRCTVLGGGGSAPGMGTLEEVGKGGPHMGGKPQDWLGGFEFQASPPTPLHLSPGSPSPKADDLDMFF
jgi:hypothetical protein